KTPVRRRMNSSGYSLLLDRGLCRLRYRCSVSHFHAGADTGSSAGDLPLIGYSSAPRSYSFAEYFTLAAVRDSFNSFAFAPASSIVKTLAICLSFLSHVRPEPSSRAGDLSHKILYI